MNTFVCAKCGYIAFDEAPEKCPVCGAPKKIFEADPSAIKKPADPANLTDLEKKHIPVIDIKKQCGLVGPGCTDVNIKIGSVVHVMEAAHFIMYLDVYLDKKFISRVHFSPEVMNPAAGLHLKASSGKLTALENCNIHGRWMTEADLS